jgi:hypothetical protein
MNSYDLADELDNILKAIGLEDNRVPTMLRQQAEKINNMEIWEKKYLDRIEELEKQLNIPKTYVLDGKQVFDTTPQIKEHCDPLCKPSVCNCVKEEK